MKPANLRSITAAGIVFAFAFLMISCEKERAGPVESPVGGGSLAKPEKPTFLFDITSGTAQTSNGDIITMTGGGQLSMHPKGAQGGGTFTFTPASGSPINGFWVVKDNILRVFQSFGPDGACTQGGRATMVVNFSPGLQGTFSSDATLSIVSTAGSPQHSFSTEGIIVSVHGKMDFDQNSGGTVAFTLSPCP